MSSAKPARAGTAKRARSLSAIVAGLGSIALVACDGYHGWDHRRLDNPTAVGLSDPEVRHPIRFVAHREILDIEVPAGAEGLSPNQHADVVAFLLRHRREAKSRLMIQVPRGVRHQAAMARSVQDIQRHVADAGIDYRMTPLPRQERSSDVVPAVRLAYERPIAIPPPCGDWSEDVGRNEERIPYPNWACATQHNTAVMVDNARDLIVPQPEDPRSGERRSALWSTYAGSGGKGGGGDAAAGSKGGAAEAAKK
jgi:pilus assembly protein CpaD